jgi:hypothetical protein
MRLQVPELREDSPMLERGTMKKALVLLAVAACGGSTVNDLGSPAPAPSATAPLPQVAEMEFTGFYDVPVPSELTAAATYVQADVHWSMQNGVAHLDYQLPVGLVGSAIHVEFNGPFDPNSSKQTLTGPAGTAECTVTATSVSCFETMFGLLPIAADMAVIEAIAKQDYAGPANERLDVSRRFIGDPLGIVRFDLATGVAVTDEDAETDDHDDDDGSKKQKGKGKGKND